MEAMLKVLFYFFLILLLLINSVLTQSTVRPLSSGVERTALFDLRGSLGIKARYWPRKLDPCTNWTGVECGNGRVIGINLSGLRRTRAGSSSPTFSINSLVRCTQLATFNSSGFALPGRIPDWLGQNLSALQVLDLTSSSIIGPIPPSIGSLNQLNLLLLSNNSLTGIIPDSLRRLSSLSILNLSSNMLTGSIPSSFSALANLTTLDLSSNFLSGPVPPSFGSFSRLQFLNLSNNSLASSLPVQLGNLSQLIDLDLDFNSLSGSFPIELGQLTNLRRLSIRNNNLGGNLPSNFTPNIILLDVSSNNFTGNLPSLSTFPNTSGVTLNFSNNQFYGILNSSLPNVNSIDISNNYLQGLNTNVENRTLTSRNCFLRIPNQRSLEDCRTFYLLRNLPFNDDSIPATPFQPQFPRKRNKNRLKYVMAGVFGGLGIFIIIIAILFIVFKPCNKRTVSQRSANVEPVQEEGAEKSQTISVNLMVDSFSYDQLLQATSGFNDTNLIKHGHSGDIFSGKLEDGVSVVVKRVDMRHSRKDCYMNELHLFGKGAHTRLVPLLGHSLGHETEKLLVYKFMPNGDLSNSLFRSNTLDDSGLQSLDWITRLKIAIGTAEGLCYLHHECNPPIVHRDIQASSILLDDKYDVRLGSLSEVCVQGVEDNQNVITRLLRISSISESTPSGSSTPPICAYDVYCFGKVLLELVTGKIGIKNSEWVDQTLSFINNYDKELISKIIDQSLVIDEDLMEEVWAVAIVAKSCLNPKASKRPQMSHILKALENPFRVVREEDFSSGRLRNNSSRRSWSAALFGSWRQSFSGSVHSQSQKSREGVSSGQRRENSQGSGANDKRLSSEIFPEPLDINDVERQDETR